MRHIHDDDTCRRSGTCRDQRHYPRHRSLRRSALRSAAIRSGISGLVILLTLMYGGMASLALPALSRTASRHAAVVSVSVLVSVNPLQFLAEARTERAASVLQYRLDTMTRT